MAADQTHSQLQLPMAVITPSDVGRLMQEVENINNMMRQASVQQQVDSVQLPKTSRLLDELVSVNKLGLREEADRNAMMQLLEIVRTKAPVLHLSFNADPSPIFTERLMTWLRQQIHPFVLLQIGLQPNIGAGCVLRTTNKYFDFSLKQHFTDSRPLLIAKLRGQDAVATAAPTSAEVAAA